MSVEKPVDERESNDNWTLGFGPNGREAANLLLPLSMSGLAKPGVSVLYVK